MLSLADADQRTVDEAVTALAWSIYRDDRAAALAEQAVQETGLGNVPDNIEKNRCKTFGALRDLMAVRTVGVIEELPAAGLVKYGKPVGVVAAICPSTNPTATPMNKAMMAIKGANAIIIAPSPSGWHASALAVDYARSELERAGFDPDLVQVLPRPVTKHRSETLMQAADLVVCTGSGNNVRRAYSSGTPAIGVGVGNVAVIVDESADIEVAVEKIVRSKTFDNATSCSSENSLVILDAVYDATLAVLQNAGGYLANEAEKRTIVRGLWPDGKLNRDAIAKDPERLAELLGLGDAAGQARFIMVEDEGVGPDHPLSGEKLSLVLTIYRAEDFDRAKEIVKELLEHQGKGHSCGIHTNDVTHTRALAESLPVTRVLVNQAHAMGNGGSFDNALNFTLSIGCGTWGGNSISENLNARHFINVTHLVTSIPESRPTEEVLFGSYWRKHGR